MTSISSLEIQSRTGSGTGPAREVRRKGFVPAVVYGNEKKPINLQIEERLLVKEMKKNGFSTTVFEITVDGKKERALVRDVQLHPVTDRPLHVDFLRISKDSRLHLQVPIHCINQDKSPGVKKGGVVNLVHHTVDVYCSPDNIPESLEIDLAGQDIGFTLHANELKLPKGVTYVHMAERETLANIVPPKVAAEGTADGTGEDAPA